MPLVQIASPDVRTHSPTPGRASSLPCLCIRRDIFIYTFSPKDIFTQYLHLTTQFKCDRTEVPFPTLLISHASYDFLSHYRYSSTSPLAPSPQNLGTSLLSSSRHPIHGQLFIPCVSTEAPLSPLLLFISHTTEPAFTAVLEAVPVPLPWMPLSPGRPSPVDAPVPWTLLPGSPCPPWGLSLWCRGQPHAATPSLEPCPAQSPLETLCHHTQQIQTHQLLHSRGHCPQGLLLCPSPFCVPFQPLPSHLPAPREKLGQVVPLLTSSGWVGMSHFLVTEPAGRWVPRTGQPYFCSFSNTPLFLPPFTWLNWVNSSRKILWKHFFFLSVGARV